MKILGVSVNWKWDRLVTYWLALVGSTFHANYLLWKQFALNVRSFLLGKIRKYFKMLSAEIFAQHAKHKWNIKESEWLSFNNLIGWTVTIFFLFAHYSQWWYGPHHAKAWLQAYVDMKAQISLHIRAGWSGPSLSTNRIIVYNRMFQRRANAQVKLCACAGWCESTHFGHAWRHFFTWHVQYE